MNFSSRQRLHRFASTEYGVARFKIEHSITNDLSFLFKSQMRFESSVSFYFKCF